MLCAKPRWILGQTYEATVSSLSWVTVTYHAHRYHCYYDTLGRSQYTRRSTPFNTALNQTAMLEVYLMWTNDGEILISLCRIYLKTVYFDCWCNSTHNSLQIKRKFATVH